VGKRQGQDVVDAIEGAAYREPDFSAHVIQGAVVHNDIQFVTERFDLRSQVTEGICRCSQGSRRAAVQVFRAGLLPGIVGERRSYSRIPSTSGALW
jgi:hypothetical protein